ncbi:MAG TPA: TetR/AcrR family transcriptional regulator, partial [Mycobacterium sp.]|nr:TetR/AcrR family transcriptional regulator [Mycobacterium sp.]
EQTRVGIGNIVRTIAGDARIGRLLFSAHLGNPVVVRKRVESSALLAMLSGQHAGTVLRLPENDQIRAAGHFVVGGVAQTISAWLAGEVRFKPERLIEQLAALLDKLADPALYRD